MAVMALNRAKIALDAYIKVRPAPRPSPARPAPRPSPARPAPRTISLNNDMTKRSHHGQKKTLILNYLMITDSYMNMIYRLNKVHIVL